MRLKQIHGAQGFFFLNFYNVIIAVEDGAEYVFSSTCSMFIFTEQLSLIAVENLLATGEGGQTFEPAKFKLLLHHRKLELQASNQVMMVFMAIVMIMVMIMAKFKLLLHHRKLELQASGQVANIARC